MFIVALLEYPAHLRVKRYQRLVQVAQGIELETKGRLPDPELDHIRPVQAVDTVGTTRAVLEDHGRVGGVEGSVAVQHPVIVGTAARL